jgi:hypothetical protein
MGGMVSEETKIRSALEAQEIKPERILKLAKEYPEIMEDVISYITNQCNDSSLRGKIDFYQYRLLLENSVDGLHGVIYDVHFPRNDDELAVRDTIYIATRNFISMLFTRIYHGLDNEIILTDLRTRNPVQIIGQTQQVR